jgi:two-component system, NarL family, sensor kinase
MTMKFFVIILFTFLTAIAQVMVADNTVSITVEDNGKGVDVHTIRSSEGMGMNNVKSRVDYFKGTMDVRSNPGEGTSVFIRWKTGMGASHA